ncbi:unnamed protein product [Owenia fusiformis]|uniref:ascorbate ferrireductase (transmembrane) n=1 Tax=Owenia fusiformis TaxID=6347 RepID=A0A8S4NR02_OWEFU|nr:unnamed protein product [Owenia fusiformis]
MAVYIISIIFAGFITYTAWPGSSLFSWHPTLMTIAFALLMCQAVMVFSPYSIFKAADRKSKTQWHWIVMIAAMVTSGGGLATIVYNKYRNGASHFTTWHGLIGLITMIYMCCQSSGGTLLLYHNLVKKFVKLKDMKMYHATSGLFMYMLASASLVLGMYSSWFQAVVTGTSWYVCASCPGLLALFVMNQITTAYLPKPAQPRM